MTVWEALFRMLWRLDAANMEGGLIDGAAAVAREMGAASESVKGLALLLYNYYEGKRDLEKLRMLQQPT